MEYLSPFLVSCVLPFLLYGATLATAHANDHSTRTHNYQPPSTSFIHLAGASKGDGASGIRDVKTYLRKFGYLKLGINKEVDDQFDEQFESALLTNQVFFKLNKIGVSDHDTVTMMSKPRCGNPDILHDKGNNKHFKRRYQLTPRLEWIFVPVFFLKEIINVFLRLMDRVVY